MGRIDVMKYVDRLRSCNRKDVIKPEVWLPAALILLTLLAGCTLGNRGGRQANIAVDAIIIYEREGGFAGIGQEWVIHLDGTIDGPGEQQLTVPSEEVMALVETSIDSKIESLAPNAAAPDACCDQFTYTLTFVSGDEEWSLVMTDTSEQPPEISELFSMTEELIADAEPVP